MKSRSHRPPVSEPRHDDWVDGSWTVDCICGVNFDDGEEMVDCDECGVWVHTRCSRYVKSEKSFACDKCKNKNSVSGGGASSGVRNDSEEAEVAEFLVELPTKTMLDTPNPSSVSSRKPFRLWANIPMEERVHVQGVLGGESSFFSGSKMSSIFGPQLWEATGYVPKKSNFQYTEFPWFENDKAEEKKVEEMDKKGEENAKQVTNGAGVLLSLLKDDKIFPTSRPQATFMNSGKRKKEQIAILKRQIEKKKLKTVEKEGKTENQFVQDSKAASSDANFSRGKGSEVASSIDLQSCKDGLSVHRPDSLGECATNLASNEHGLDPTLGNNVSADEISRAENGRHEMHVVLKNLSKVNNDLELVTNPTERITVKVEVPQDSGYAGGDVLGPTGSVIIGPLDKEPLTGDLTIAKAELIEDNPEIGVAIRRPNKKLKGELVDDGIKKTRVESLPVEAVKLNSMKAATRCVVACAIGQAGQGKVTDARAMSSELNDSKFLDTSKSIAVGHARLDKSDASPDNLYATTEEPMASEFPLGTRKMSPGLEHDSEVGEKLLKSNDTIRSHSTNSCDHKVVVALVEPSSTSGIVVKSSDKHVAMDAKNLSVQSRHKELPEGNVGTRKQNILPDTVGHDGKCGKPRKFVKESPRSSSLSKTPDSTKFSHMSDSKRLTSDSKDFNIPSSKSMPNATTVRFSGEGVSPQVEAAPNSRNKDVVLAEPGKGGKSYRVGTQPSARGSVSVTSTTPASPKIPAALSDEELALLLHQELNSSPRVPRVSRMRHAGSLPQLTCPSAVSMLVKRTFSGGKDHNVTSRKKSKDLSGEGPRGYGVDSREAKKMERKPASLDDRRQDSGCSTYQLSQEADCGPVKNVQYTKKASGTSFLSSDANGQNAPASCPPTRNASDDDPRMIGCQEQHTLPGLIAEIMREGKRMTYEELCNAVLPHWPHLRKHNGERYAYSSHSQAVLDCLRNRSEWARLVDRGPKTTASRKRRRLDADSLSIESEENDDSITKNAKDVASTSFKSHQEDFPKGKRKARKRRRLALQGRGLVRRRRRTDIVSDEDSESFSNSIGDSTSSEEEIQGDGTSAVGSDASTSSDDGR